MSRYGIARCITAVAFTILLLFAPTVTAGELRSGPEVVTVVPQETDEILANPGMGWETFHATRDKDKNLPDWIPSTVHYARWGWGTLEPGPGKIDYAFLDKVLQETRRAGQRLAFRVMCCSTTRGQPYHPAWLEKIGGKVPIVDYESQKELPVPDLDDPLVLELHLDFIRRLGIATMATQISTT